MNLEYFLNRNIIFKSTAAVPNLRNARLNGEISDTVNFAAMGVNAAVNIKKIIIDNFFINT